MLLLSVLATVLAAVSSKSVEIQKRSSTCYTGLGCFNTAAPFFSIRRPLNFLPQSPQHINVKFRLFTKKNLVDADYLAYGNSANAKASHFNSKLPTKIIIHGYIDTGRSPWMHTMKNEFLKQGDYNVIVVDWGGGSAPPYTQATANTRVVGALIAQLIDNLKAETGAKFEDFHILGHSLGAHTAGYAGERLQHVGRITGLDPADPFFQGTDPKVRLDPTDALFVDAIHTDGESILKLGYGMKQPVGHVDYYPNGGMTQPGCEKDPVTQIHIEGFTEGLKQFVACNHLRSYALFTESINSRCPFEGYRCNSYEDFNSGNCMPCHGVNCGRMGLHADEVKPASHQTLVKYFLNTASDAPFCRYHYQVHVSLANPRGGRSETGYLYVALTGSQGQSGEIKVNDKLIDFTPGKSYNFILTSPSDLGSISRIAFRWEHDSHWYKPLDWDVLGLRNPTLNLNKVDVVNGETSKTFHFCDQLGLASHVTKQLSHTC